ncbi:MAG: tetratricopeptide repeat protein [Cytophagales bacterium]|nr:tetratricopeptide repeat protein [Cytophagales bacterium]MDW8384597.1 tetratricopeptide repeat protein [Flammeovirgaceae bacterium]
MKLFERIVVISFFILTSNVVAQQKNPPAAKPATPPPNAPAGAGAAKPSTPPKGNKHDLLMRANDLMESNRFEEALLMLADAIKIDPNDPVIYYKQGLCYTNLGNFREAIAPLQKATSLKKEYVEAHELLARVYQELKNIKGAIAELDLAFKYDDDPSNKLTYKLEILDILFSANKFGLAKAHLYDAKTLPEGLGETFDVKFKEAQFLNFSGQYDKALKILQEIIDEEISESEDGTEQYFFEYGVSLHMLGRYKEAEQQFAKAARNEYKAKIRRYQPETYYEIALTYFNVLDYENSEKNLEIVYKMNPNFQDASDLKLKLASIKADQRATIKAIEEQIKKEKDPKILSQKYEDLAFYYFKAGDFQMAELNADQCLKIREFDMKITFLKAMCEYKLKQPAQATDLLVRASKNPKLTTEDKARLNFVLGLLYESAENYSEATKCFRQSAVGPFKSASIVKLETINRIRQGLGQEDYDSEETSEETNE